VSQRLFQSELSKSISLRACILALIGEATAAGARLSAVCAALGLSPRTFQRWQNPAGEICEDRRPCAERPVPANRLSKEQRDRIIATCNAAEFASLPPSQIVPRLADQGLYIVSESSMYRVLRERGQNHRRGRARPPGRSSTSSAGNSLAGRSTTGRRQSWPPSCSNARSGLKGALPSRLSCMPTMVAP
jgi:hypothetical protein